MPMREGAGQVPKLLDEFHGTSSYAVRRCKIALEDRDHNGASADGKTRLLDPELQG